MPFFRAFAARVPLARLANTLLAAAAAAAADGVCELRTMAEARIDNGERLFALNELFIGHRSHRSARYRSRADGISESQSSSGLIVATDTGSTGWARSIMEATAIARPIAPAEPVPGYFVREPFPSISSGTTLRAGKITDTPLRICSQMNAGGVIFADGIEQDFLAFDWGRELVVSVSSRKLRLYHR